MKIIGQQFIGTLFGLGFSGVTLASQIGTNAWENILNKIATSLTGPVAYAIAVIAIVICGLMMAFSDLQGGARRFAQACCGLSIAFFAAQIATQFLGFSGATL